MAARKVSTAKRTPAAKRSASAPAPANTPRRPRAVRKTRTTTATDAPIAAAPTAEQIRQRAYFLHLERKGRPGDPVADWFRAEQELAGSSTPDA